MLSPKERLVHLLALAEKGPALRAALAEEVADLLLDWPADCPDTMRRPCEILLERIAREADTDARERLAERLESHTELPASLLNILFFVASRSFRKDIIKRNQNSDLPVDDLYASEIALIHAARCKTGFAVAFARLLNLPDETARHILKDASGQSFTIACKGGHISRAGFSALVLLTAKEPSTAWLEIYETVPLYAAERMLASWRAPAPHLHVAAE